MHTNCTLHKLSFDTAPTTPMLNCVPIVLGKEEPVSELEMEGPKIQMWHANFFYKIHCPICYSLKKPTFVDLLSNILLKYFYILLQM